jgi:hypothetical protein
MEQNLSLGNVIVTDNCVFVSFVNQKNLNKRESEIYSECDKHQII